MNKIWEIYEKLNEIVYVCDMDTYELEYMNRKALQEWGFTSLEQVKGKKCYEILQNCSEPCKFCTNHLLQEGDFYEWKHHNDIADKNYSLKDTVIVQDGKRYRMELAIDMSVQDEQKNTILNFIRNEMMINEGLRIALSKSMPDEALMSLMEYLGRQLECERIYIFEESGEGYVDNTYEWCAEGVVPQIDNLKNVPYEAVSFWYEQFKRNENVIIPDLEAIKDSDPLNYAYLKPQDIYSLIVSPIISEDKIIGFFGVDNPPGELLNHISTLFNILGHFIMSLIRRRNLVNHLENLSFYDQLTGLKNRHAMYNYTDSFGEDSIGILYVDVMGLKRVNDTLGHKAGDELLNRACASLRKCCAGHEIFRIGGDEFVVICKGITEPELKDIAMILRMDSENNHASVAIGCEWNRKYDSNIDYLLVRADNKMYEDKRTYYNNGSSDRRHK